MEKDRFQSQLNFILEVDKLKTIERQTHITGFSRRENDAEHSFHMALMLYLLKEYANEEIDLSKAMMMALIHDIVEIDAGDTYAYDETALKTQAERENKAKERIFSLLPPDQKDELVALFDEFEKGETAEARFVKAIDNFQPLLLNDFNDGGDWKEHKTTKTKVLQRHNKSQLGSTFIGEYSKEMIMRNVENGNIKDE